MDVKALVDALMEEIQGPVWKEAVKGTSKFRTVVQGNSPVKKAILSSEHMLADVDLAQRPRGVNVHPGELPGYFRAPGMMERTQELADAIRQNPRPSLTERGFMKAHGYLQDTEGQRALLPMLDRMAAQDTMPPTPLLRQYWQGEIGDQLDQARAARLFVMHGRTPGSEVHDSTSLVDRLSREHDLARHVGSPTVKYVRPDGYIDVQPSARQSRGESEGALNANGPGKPMVDHRYGEALQGITLDRDSAPEEAIRRIHDAARNYNPPPGVRTPDIPLGSPKLAPRSGDPTILPLHQQLQTPRPNRRLSGGAQGYGPVPGDILQGQDMPGRQMHLPAPQQQPDWRTPDQMIAARKRYIQSLPANRPLPFETPIDEADDLEHQLRMAAPEAQAPDPQVPWHFRPIPMGADAPPDPRTASAFVADLLGPDAAKGNPAFDDMIKGMFGSPHRPKPQDAKGFQGYIGLPDESAAADIEQGRGKIQDLLDSIARLKASGRKPKK